MTKKFVGKHSDVTEKILGAFYEVYNSLGYGFAEKVNENALTFEILQNGLLIEQQKPIAVYYHHNLVGEFNADLLINEVVLVELKACKQLIPEHEAQLLNYLKSTRIEVGLLLNFGPKAQYLRKVFDNERKGTMNWVNK